MDDVNVYATGVLSDLQAIGRALNPWVHPDPRLPAASVAGWRRHALAHRLRRLAGNARHASRWRGYYAEGAPGRGGAGTGWTKRRAVRDLDRRYPARS